MEEDFNDVDLIKEILDGGNKHAENTLYNKYKTFIKGFLNKNYSKNFDVDDDVSEILINIFLKLDTYDNTKSKFKSWVVTITKNYMVDKWRKNTLELSSYDNNSNLTNIPLFDCLNYSTTACVDFEINNSISYASSNINSEDLKMLNMKYVEGYNYSEIGDHFNLTSDTVSNKVNYLKTKLKKKLKNH
jgi:RNA polymerase sigma-70 factor (ECF subfamily)